MGGYAAVQAMIPLAAIDASVDQVRRDEDSAEGGEKIRQLAQTIEQHGVLQPILVAPMEQQGRYRLVVGHRRLMAATQAGLDSIPAVVRPVDVGDVALIQLVENVQRQDLSPADEAAAYEALMQRHGFSQRALARLVGVSDAHISARLAIARDEELRTAIERGVITKTTATKMVALKAPYDAPFRLLLQQGQSFTSRQVIAALDEQTQIERHGRPARRGPQKRHQYTPPQATVTYAVERDGSVALPASSPPPRPVYRPAYDEGRLCAILSGLPPATTLDLLRYAEREGLSVTSLIAACQRVWGAQKSQVG